MSPTSSMFLLGESREHPMHVGGLTLLQPPEGGDAADVRALLDAALARGAAGPLFRKRAKRSWSSAGQWGWEPDDQFDIGHHVRHDALPQPGGFDELTALVSRLHSTLLDRNRPLWETHLIEGLADGRYAVYTKIHHAVADGISAMRLLRSALSTDADERAMRAPWEPHESKSALPVPVDAALDLPGTALRAARNVVGEVAGLVPALTGTIDRALNDRGGSMSLAAPKTVFNVPITGARQFAARSWPLERLRMIAKCAEVTINDVVLALCAGGLRNFLADLDALPEQPLVAMVPVAVASKATEDPGNNVGILMCNLGTHLDDPTKRLAVVRMSMSEGKDAMRTMSPTQILAMSALGAAPLAVNMLLGDRSPIRSFNLVISNVPGPTAPLYWNGARVDALYPLSIPVDGQALNITCTSNDDSIAFGLTGCRSIPDLQPLLDHLDAELGALEAAVGI